MKVPFYVFLFSTLVGLSMIALDNYGYSFDLQWLTSAWNNLPIAEDFSQQAQGWLVTAFSWLNKLVIPGSIVLLWMLGRGWVKQDQQPKLRCIHNKHFIKSRDKHSKSKKKDFF